MELGNLKLEIEVEFKEGKLITNIKDVLQNEMRKSKSERENESEKS